MDDPVQKLTTPLDTLSHFLSKKLALGMFLLFHVIFARKKFFLKIHTVYIEAHNFLPSTYIFLFMNSILKFLSDYFQDCNCMSLLPGALNSTNECHVQSEDNQSK